MSSVVAAAYIVRTASMTWVLSDADAWQPVESAANAALVTMTIINSAAIRLRFTRLITMFTYRSSTTIGV